MSKPGAYQIFAVAICGLLWWSAMAGASGPTHNPAEEFEYPRPTGPHPVGSRFLFLEDPSRLDTYSDEPNDHRWISTKVWYPAEPLPEANAAPFGDDEFTRSMVTAGLFDPRFLDVVALQPSASFHDAPIAAEGAPWPVLIYSASGVITANVFLYEELASHGYVVLAVGHPYWCEFYFDGRGEMFHFDKNNRYYTEMWVEETSREVIETKELITRSTDAEKKLVLYKRLNKLMPTEVSDLVLWQGDIEFLIAELGALNAANGPYRGRLDTKRIGILGYSKGGALASQVCATSDRIKAGVNLGGFAFGGQVENDLKSPFMTLEHVEPLCSECPPISLPFFERSMYDAYIIQIDGANHATFTDLPMLKEFILADGVLSPLDGKWSAVIVRSYLLAFFDTYVKGLPRSPMLDEVPSPFGEVRYFKRLRGASAPREPRP